MLALRYPEYIIHCQCARVQNAITLPSIILARAIIQDDIDKREWSEIIYLLGLCTHAIGNHLH